MMAYNRSVTAPELIILEASSYPGWSADHEGNVYFQGRQVDGWAYNGRVYVKANNQGKIKRAQIVCDAWHGPRPSDKHGALHKDDDKANDAPTNLYWGTGSDNRADAITNGIRTGGRLTDDDVVEIKAKYATGQWSQRELGYIYGVSGATICRAINDYPGRH